MQLKRIQLNGFKSFVDPTSIPVLSCMNAIVGPNGCGKSNIVDAIRWVTGETSAKQLRGQSMSDVIFNGTTGRKPVGKAAVELTFDNSDRRITGEYAAFSEISIRREVVRDGQSAYFINGVPARRRDLVDLFLGTGLGPRSYAVIEQGMISQLIEAKPEDMRTHLEEVAGISKYRERRRETENRIHHTQDNLDRLNDVRDELEKQLRHLEHQSAAAEKYKVLQAELRLLHAQMKALQWKNFENQLADKKENIAQQAVQYESRVAELRECEMNIEKSRIEAQVSADKKDGIQKQFYGISSEIARLEQQIQHKQEQLKQWESELRQSESLQEELTSQAGNQTNQIDILMQEVATLKPQASELQNALQEANHLLAEAEQQMIASQSAWDCFQEQQAKTNQQLEVAKNNIRHYETQQQQLGDRRTQLQTQLNVVSVNNVTHELSPLSQQSDELKNTITQIQTILAKLSQAILNQRALHQTTHNTMSQAQGDLQKLEAQHASLSALQQAALQDHQVDMRPWLEKTGLSKQAQLGKTIQVEAGWEAAIETILGNYFDAVCVASIDDAAKSIAQLEKGQVTLLQSASHSTARLSHKTVRDVIQNNANLPAWTAGIYIADHLTEALRLRAQLTSTESIITREGQWVGSNWIHVSKSDSSEDNFLLREKQLKQLEADIAVQKEKLQLFEKEQQAAKIALEQLESSRDAKHRQFQETTAALTDVQTNLSAKRSRLETLSQQQQQLKSDIQQIESQLSQCESALSAAREAVNSHSQSQHAEIAQREKIVAARSTAETVLASARATAQTKKQTADERHIRLTSGEKQVALLSQTLQANQKQLTQLNDRRRLLAMQLADADAPLTEWSEALQVALTQRVTIENELRLIDARVQQEHNQLKQFESIRDRLSKSIATSQEHQQQCKLAIQEMVVRQTTLKEQLLEMQFQLHTILDALPDDAELLEWENNANALQANIDRLGPINLAAIDEFKTVTERKTYLDNQVADLVEALEILQNAIRKIDRETRHLFKDTFDQVTLYFQKLFPRIFGGGQASLELTDEDLLTTGIIVRAQPPGKRNATIHMLSGGEKTLTAIALMFALFQLNPAPFCVLDEVDAPLDDLNVGRYCQLIKEMSTETQFLIISHNKVTIETADHLMGVTMQEPGVSRIVSVDMQEAVALVEA
ncbi:MAG: chromosome segregation protein SMC [Gammaproteobacteria bacterium RIFCSPHIGHO2_02_FULL_39_13]|nr:MAG: chromosome segregation protein SMC [Gammaproteobacteria bacterium RIFCSPHIGHO2_02_FULL_39_13]OGT50139.1 MAG: chromosome segregation protein SMC [Gammaproteobacteria bacterium RIFCSPHIGHO2_12_FULL_39_24]